MKFTAAREQLLPSATHIEKIAGKAKDLPILSCVYFCVEGEQLCVRGTNLEVGVEYTVAVKDGEDGEVAVAANVFAQIITAAPSGSTVVCEKKDQVLVVRVAGSVARVALHDAQEFPVIPQVEDPVDVRLPAQALVTVLKNVAGYTSLSTIKPELASVFVQVDGGELIAAATDSFRLAEKRVGIPNGVECEPFLIPARSIQDVLHILENETGEVVITRNSHQFAIVRSGVYATFRLTSGNFPAYEQVIPKEFGITVTVLVADFERVLKKHSIFLNKSYKTTVTVSGGEGTCVVDTQNDSVGELHDEIHATIEGEGDVCVSFNQKYLIDAFGPIPTDSCVLHFVKTGGPLLVTPVGDASFRYLVMPMNN